MLRPLHEYMHVPSSLQLRIVSVTCNATCSSMVWHAFRKLIGCVCKLGSIWPEQGTWLVPMLALHSEASSTVMTGLCTRICKYQPEFL